MKREIQRVFVALVLLVSMTMVAGQAAGDVRAKVRGGNLVIRGDNLGNAIEISPGTAPGEFVITGLPAGGAPTMVNGQDIVNLSGVHGHVRIDAGSGNDIVRLRQVAISGDLTIKSKGGDDSFMLVDATLGGKVKFNGGHGSALFQLIRSTVEEDVSPSLSLKTP